MSGVKVAGALAKTTVEGLESMHFGKAIIETLTHCKEGLKCVYNSPITDSFSRLANDTASKLDLGTVILGGAINGSALGWTGVKFFEDKRRLWNINSEKQDLLLPQQRAINLSWMSATAAALAFIPFVSGINKVAGKSLIKISGNSGFSQSIGFVLNGIGRLSDLAVQGVLATTKTIGHGIDQTVNFFPWLLGLDFKTDAFSKVMSKQYIFIHGLLATRAGYKWLKVDRTQTTGQGLAGLTIGGVGIFNDNDHKSQTYLQSLELQNAKAEKAQEQSLLFRNLGLSVKQNVARFNRLIS